MSYSTKKSFSPPLSIYMYIFIHIIHVDAYYISTKTDILYTYIYAYVHIMCNIYIYIPESYPQDLHWQATCYRNLTRLPIGWRPQLSSWPLATRRKRAPAQKYETYGDKPNIFLLVINLWW